MKDIKNKKRFKYIVPNFRIMSILFCLGIILLSSCYYVQSQGIRSGHLISPTTVDKNDQFIVSFYVDTNVSVTSFVIRQLTWQPTLVNLVDAQFKGPWNETEMVDNGIWYRNASNNHLCDNRTIDPQKLEKVNVEGNLTYVQSLNLGGVTGYNLGVEFTFVALKEGTVDFIIPETIWLEASGLDIGLGNATFWTNAETIIIGDEPPPEPDPEPDPDPDPEPPTPPVNKKPIGIIDCPVNGIVNESIFFNGSLSYDEDGEILYYYWSFGEGTWDLDNGIEEGAEVYHTFERPGNYTVILMVVDDNGGESFEHCFMMIESLPEEPTEPDDEPSVEPDNNDTEPLPEPENGNDVDLTLAYVVFTVILGMVVLYLFWWTRK